MCAGHFRRERDGSPRCMERAAKRGPCDRCDGTGRVGFERCFPCGGSGELARCRRHDFAAFESLRRRNRARGLCACAAARDAESVRCTACRAREAAKARRRRSAVRALPLAKLLAAARDAPVDSPVAREARRRVRALPAEFRRYGVIGLSLHAGEVARNRRWEAEREREAADRARPVFPTLSAPLAAFVRTLVENGGTVPRRRLRLATAPVVRRGADVRRALRDAASRPGPTSCERLPSTAPPWPNARPAKPRAGAGKPCGESRRC